MSTYRVYFEKTGYVEVEAESKEIAEDRAMFAMSGYALSEKGALSILAQEESDWEMVDETEEVDDEEEEEEEEE